MPMRVALRAQPNRPRFRLRTWAVLLVLAASLPLLIFAWITLHSMEQTHVILST